MELKDFRDQIDQIDENIIHLFAQRMLLSAQIADYKKNNNLPIYIPEREQDILKRVSRMARPDLECYTQELFSFIFQLSRNYQNDRQSNSSQKDTEVV